MATWSKENIISFIDEYRSHECLWKIKSKDYSNRLKKERSYRELIDFVKQFEPNADKELVLRKISNLRNAFRKQLRKLDTMKVSGSGADDMVEPKLWYFNALEFLRDQETPRPSQSNIQPELSEEQQFSPLDVELEVLESPTDPLIPSSSRSTTPQQTPNPRSACDTGSSESGRRPTKRKSSPVENELLTLARNRLLNPPNTREEDQFDSFGKTVGHKLRNIPRDQSVHAQKLISDILYEADLGTLSRNTVISRIPAYSEQQQHLMASAYSEQAENPPMMNTDVYRSYDYQ